MPRDIISPNFEICYHEGFQKWVLEFPEHIDRHHDHDPRLDYHQLIELRYLLDEVIRRQFDF